MKGRAHGENSGIGRAHGENIDKTRLAEDDTGYLGSWNTFDSTIKL